MTDYRFSFKEGHNGEAIAVISEGKDEGKVIYLNESNNDLNEIMSDRVEQFYEFAKNKKLKQSDYDEILDCIEANEPPDDKRLYRIYTDFKNQIKKTSEVILHDSRLEVCPMLGYNEKDRKSRETILVNGANNSGKSYWTGEYLKKWRKLFPKSPIYLLSNKPLSDEPAFAGIKNIQQITLTKKNLENIIGEEAKITKKKSKLDDDSDYSESEDDETGAGYFPYMHFVSKTGQSMVIFDDFESDGQIEKMVRTIINSILRVGRSSRIYCIIVSHTLNGGQKTKSIFTEIDAFCLFNKGISPYHLKYCLKNYTSMNEKQITKVVDSDSRWVFIHKSMPKYVVESQKLWLY